MRGNLFVQMEIGMEIEMKMEIEVEWLLKEDDDADTAGKVQSAALGQQRRRSAPTPTAPAPRRGPRPTTRSTRSCSCATTSPTGGAETGSCVEKKLNQILLFYDYDSYKNEPLSALKRDKAARLNIFNRKQLQNSGFSRIGRGAI